jgi:hypothetical protein
MLEPIPFAGMVEIDESFDRTVNHMAGEYVSYNEPVAWMVEGYDGIGSHVRTVVSSKPKPDSWVNVIPLYTHPVKTLTDEEITQIAYQTPLQAMTTLDIDCLVVFARAILRKAAEK